MRSPLILKPICVDVLSDSNLNVAKEMYYPFRNDGLKLLTDPIVAYLDRIGYLYNNDNQSFYRLNPSDGRYYRVDESDVNYSIDRFISFCKTNELFNLNPHQVESIKYLFKSRFNLIKLDKRYHEFLGNDDGSGYDYDLEEGLYQLNNGLFHPYLKDDDYPFTLLPNCGLYFTNHLRTYNVDFYPIKRSEIFNTDECDDFLYVYHDIDTLKFILWWAGAILFSYPFRLPMYLLLYGSGGSGKDTLALCLWEILGDCNCSKSTLSSLITPRDKAILYDKRINVSSELEGHSDKKLISAIKELTGGGKIQADPKYKDPLSIYPPALLFLGNKYPEFDSSDPGIIRRSCIIHCNENLDPTGVNWQKLLRDSEHRNWLFNASYYIWMENKEKLPRDMKSEFMLECDKKLEENNPFSNWLISYCGSTNYDDVRTCFYDRGLNELYRSYTDRMYELEVHSLIGKLNFSSKIQNEYRLELNNGHGKRVFKFKK